jgi:hypothetical protein
VLLVYQSTLLTGSLDRKSTRVQCNKSASLLSKHGSFLRTLISESKNKDLICQTGLAMFCLHHELKIWLRGRLKVLANIESSYRTVRDGEWLRRARRHKLNLFTG